CSPCSPWRTKRSRHWPTVWRSQPSSAAMSWFEGLSDPAARRMRRQRNASDWGVERARTRDSSCARTVASTSTAEAKGRGMALLLADNQEMIWRVAYEVDPIG